MEHGVLELEAFVEVNVVQVHERHDPGIGPVPAEVELCIHAVEVRFKEACGYPACPFVKIPGDDPVSDQFGMIKDVSDEQLVHLFPSLEKRRAHVQIYEMEVLSPVDRDLGPQAAARLIAPHRNVVILRFSNRQPA